MKTKGYLLIAAIAASVTSCDTNSKKSHYENQTKTDTSENELSKLYDSIKKAKEIELSEIYNDSVEAIQIKGYSVKKLSGKHKYGGATKIQYKSLSQLIAEAQKESEKEMWTNEKFQNTIETYKRACKGGAIRLDIERTTISAANTEYFSIIIKDTAENELYRVDLDSDIPETPVSNEYWWNLHTEWIPKRIKTPFYIYVIDRLEDAPFKFEVTAIKK